jgi:acyl-CoA thioester hydrolase
MIKQQFGPILFREECLFKKEIRLNDKITIDIELVKSRKDFSRWSIQHTILKNGENVCAIVIVDGAWIDTAKRKLTVPPELIANIFGKLPAAEKFEWTN